jgi:hypothetical protein
MSATPRFFYFLSCIENPVIEGGPIWREPLPLERKAAEKLPPKPAGNIFRYGDYFQAARIFLEQDGYRPVTVAAGRRLQKAIRPEDIRAIRILLEKHGEFYHPARIEVVCADGPISLVLNVAVSETGKACIQQEYGFLKALNQKYPVSYLPQVYSQGDVEIKDTVKVGMFLGQWFDAYSEFHISADPSDHKNKIRVWDGQGGLFFLSPGQTVSLYAQAAGILTHYYNLESFEQIFPWHHAAGDFVVKAVNDKVALKLIAVRRYAPLFDQPHGPGPFEKDAELILQALLLFLLNLSIRMRLDRLEGVGEMVWADDPAVYGTLTGILKSLALKSAVPALPDSPIRCFQYYLSCCTQADLFDLSMAILNSFNPKTPEVPVIRQNLQAHVDTLYRAIRENYQSIKTGNDGFLLTTKNIDSISAT